MQAYDLTMCEYFRSGFIDFMLKGKSLFGYKNLFSRNYYEQNDKIILKQFQQNLSRLKCIVIFIVNIENLKKLKHQIFFKKTLSLSIVYSKCGHEYKEIFKEKELMKIMKILGLINNIEDYQKI